MTQISMKTQGNHRHQVSTYLDDDELEFIHEKMVELGCSRSEAVKLKIKEWMREEQDRRREYLRDKYL